MKYLNILVLVVFLMMYGLSVVPINHDSVWHGQAVLDTNMLLADLTGEMATLRYGGETTYLPLDSPEATRFYLADIFVHGLLLMFVFNTFFYAGKGSGSGKFGEWKEDFLSWVSDKRVILKAKWFLRGKTLG